jgi:hypothetical protein
VIYQIAFALLPASPGCMVYRRPSRIWASVRYSGSALRIKMYNRERHNHAIRK